VTDATVCDSTLTFTDPEPPAIALNTRGVTDMCNVCIVSAQTTPSGGTPVNPYHVLVVDGGHLHNDSLGHDPVRVLLRCS